MYLLKDEDGKYLVSFAGYLRPCERSKATRYTLENAELYKSLAKLQGFNYQIERM